MEKQIFFGRLSKKEWEKSDNPSMHFNLHDFYGDGMDAETSAQLELPFTDKEIDDIIKELPNDKSPGPDGFNNEFFKNCWNIIGRDVKDLIKGFYEGSINLESSNSSYITLIPKIDSPMRSGDFWPISLLNTVIKIITKLLANRLQKNYTTTDTQKSIWFSETEVNSRLFGVGF
jgi:hypothetical protein